MPTSSLPLPLTLTSTPIKDVVEFCETATTTTENESDDTCEPSAENVTL